MPIPRLCNTRPIIQQQIIKLTPQQKVSKLLIDMNDMIYQKLQDGQVKIIDTEKSIKNMTKKLIKNITNQILQGIIQINQNQVPFDVKTKNKYKDSMKLYYQNQGQNPQNQTNQYQQKILQFNKNLQKLKQSLIIEKKFQKQQHQKLQNQAKSFINQLQRKKQQFAQQLNNRKSQSQNKLLNKVLSQSIINKMKQNLQKQKQQKRKQLEEKIQKIKLRQKERLQKQVENQLEHWEKVKNYQNDKIQTLENNNNKSKRSMSQKLLPGINNYSNNNKMNFQKNYETEKNQILKNNKMSLLISEKKLSNSFISSHNIIKQLDNKMLKAKLKMKIFSKNQQKYGQQLKNNNNLQQNNSSQLATRLKLDAFSLKYSDNRYKLIGNNYLKQSLLNSQSKKKHTSLLPLLGNNNNNKKSYIKNEQLSQLQLSVSCISKPYQIQQLPYSKTDKIMQKFNQNTQNTQKNQIDVNINDIVQNKSQNSQNQFINQNKNGSGIKSK